MAKKIYIEIDKCSHRRPWNPFECKLNKDCIRMAYVSSSHRNHYHILSIKESPVNPFLSTGIILAKSNFMTRAFSIMTNLVMSIFSSKKSFVLVEEVLVNTFVLSNMISSRINLLMRVFLLKNIYYFVYFRSIHVQIFFFMTRNISSKKFYQQVLSCQETITISHSRSGFQANHIFEYHMSEWSCY